MAIRDKIRANAAHVLAPGETIQVVVPAQTKSGWLAVITYWIIILANGYRTIVVTDRRILVCRAGRFTLTPVNEVLAQFPRTTLIGPPTGLWYRCNSLGSPLYIAKRFHKDVVAADTGQPPR